MLGALCEFAGLTWVVLTVRTAWRKIQSVRREHTMSTCIDPPKTELVVIKGFESEDIEVTVEQLEMRIVPESTAGFLD